MTPRATSCHPLTKAERFCRKFGNFSTNLTLCIECVIRNYVSRVQKHSLPRNCNRLLWKCHQFYDYFLIISSACVFTQQSLLALFVFTQQSYCHGVGIRRTSIIHKVIRKLRVLGNCCMDPVQILWEATYPPYLQIIFSFFQNFKFSQYLFTFINMGPYGSQNCKTLLLPQITPQFSQTSPEFLSLLSSQSHFFRFLKLSDLEF